jgi:hypothetical protein
VKPLVLLLAASLVTLAFSLSSDSSANVRRPALRLECAHPDALRLHRFEDGSARLECAGRVLIRVSVPG